MSNYNNRRNFLKMAGIGGISVLTARAPSYPVGQPLHPLSKTNPHDGSSDIVPLNRFPRMVQEYMAGRMREMERKADQVRSSLRTKADAEVYVEAVRTKINKILGPWPERTPLNARVTGTVDGDGYTIEKVVFESRPDFLVTANLYLPRGRKRPVPGVLGLCGHAANGKAAEPYQSFSQGLARQGYAVLTIDPVGQGERLQYVDGDLGPAVGTGVPEHNLMGNQLLLAGDSLSSWFAWDGIRALDYLLSRPEVDPEHIGVTGISGGGTQTSLLCGVDPRITMAAPGCYTTTWRRNLENEEAADSEQCPPCAIAEGLDHSDFLVAMAPRPVIMLAQEKDFFDVRGTIEAFGRVKHIYGLLGAGDRIECHIGSGYHGYSQELREAMYDWFNRFTGSAAGSGEPPLALEDGKTLRCTPRGQVSAVGAKTVAAFTRERAASLAGRRTVPSEAELKRRVAGCLKLPTGGGVPDYRILRNMGERSYPSKHAVHYAVETEAGVFALLYLLRDGLHYSRIPLQRGPAILYVADRSSDGELRSEPLVRELIARYPGSAFYACDVRGIGETEPNTTSRGFDTPYGSDYFYASYGLMLDYPYAGQRTHDLLQVVRLLESAGHSDIHLVGKRWGAIPATFAALLSDTVTRVTLKNALTSYTDVAMSGSYDWPLSAFLPGVLAHFDLPDCYAALERKGLTQIEPYPARYPGGKR